jgi:hypothetical protein
LTDILDQLAILWKCRRCECASCGSGADDELNNHICTDGPHCLETREALRLFRRRASVFASHAATEIRALRRARDGDA